MQGALYHVKRLAENDKSIAMCATAAAKVAALASMRVDLAAKAAAAAASPQSVASLGGAGESYASVEEGAVAEAAAVPPVPLDSSAAALSVISAGLEARVTAAAAEKKSAAAAVGTLRIHVHPNGGTTGD